MPKNQLTLSQALCGIVFVAVFLLFWFPTVQFDADCSDLHCARTCTNSSDSGWYFIQGVRNTEYCVGAFDELFKSIHTINQEGFVDVPTFSRSGFGGIYAFVALASNATSGTCARALALKNEPYGAPCGARLSEDAWIDFFSLVQCNIVYSFAYAPFFLHSMFWVPYSIVCGEICSLDEKSDDCDCTSSSFSARDFYGMSGVTRIIETGCSLRTRAWE